MKYFLLFTLLAIQTSYGQVRYEYTFEELASITIQSVSRKAEAAFETPSAIYVITAEDIKNSPARNLPDLLRGVPGLFVGSQTANKYTVAPRGSIFSTNRYLLLIVDGRPLYFTFQGGVRWQDFDYALEDIESIEIIRGPGSVMWGANAVNGIISIQTKKLDTIANSHLTLSAGTLTNSVSLRHAFPLEDNLRMSLSVKEKYDENTRTDDQQDFYDRRTSSTGHFKLEWDINQHETINLFADVFHSTANSHSAIVKTTPIPFGFELIETTIHVLNYSFLTHYDKQINDGNFTLQYFSNFQKLDNLPVLGLRSQRHDLLLQINLLKGDSHDLSFGGGYQMNKNRTAAGSAPGDKNKELHLSHLFIQDKISLIPYELYLTLGCRFEYNTFTGYENSPTLQLSWLIDERQTLWFSFSKSYGLPAESEIVLDALAATPAFPLHNTGREQLNSSDIFTSQLGYRIEPTDQLMIDAVVFYNEYKHVIGLGNLQFTPPMTLSSQILDTWKHNSYGAEISIRSTLIPNLSQTINYSWMQNHILERDTIFVTAGDTVIPHSLSLLNDWRISKNVNVRINLHYVDNLTSGTPLSRSWRTDIGLYWQASEQMRWSFNAFSVFDSQREEVVNALTGTNQTSQIQRSFMLGMQYNF